MPLSLEFQMIKQSQVTKSYNDDNLEQASLSRDLSWGSGSPSFTCLSLLNLRVFVVVVLVSFLSLFYFFFKCSCAKEPPVLLRVRQAELRSSLYV